MILKIWLICLLCFAGQTRAEIGTFEQKLGANIPKGLRFSDEENRMLSMDALLRRDQPTLLSLIYFHCKTLCPLLANGIIKSINDMPHQGTPGFQLVLVSLDPKDTAADAMERKQMLLKRSSLPTDRLRILRGDEATIERLADAIGFRYAYDPRTEQYQHPSGLVVLTPDARVSRYFFGMEFDPIQLQAALDRSSRNLLGQLIQQLRLACFRYDSTTGTYTPAIYTIMRALAFALLIGGASAMAIYEYRRRTSSL